MNELDVTLKKMDRHYFAGQRNRVSLDFAANCIVGPENCLFLDVRTNEEVSLLQFNNVLHIPLNELPGRLEELPADRPIIIFCTTIVRASMAAFYLQAEGYAGARTLMANSEEMVELSFQF